MAEFLLKCKCGQCRIGSKNSKWYVECDNCNARAEADTLSKAIEKWNTWDFYHENKIHDRG